MCPRLIDKPLVGPALVGAALVLASAGCGLSKENFTTTASTAATTAYIVGKDQDDLVKARDFAEEEAVALRRESARGGGEHIDSLARLLGARPNDLGPWLQAHYDALYGMGDASTNLVDRIAVLQTG